MDGLAQLCGAVNVAGALDVLFGFSLNALGIVLGTEFFGGVVAVFLEGVDLAGETTENGDRACVFFGRDGELLLSFGACEELGEMGGSELESDFGELAGVVFAEVLDEIILKEMVLEGAVLFEAPFFVTAAGFPIGNVTYSDADVVFLQGADDFGMGNIVAEQTVNHVALEVGETGDFAVAGEFSIGMRILGRRGDRFG